MESIKHTPYAPLSCDKFTKIAQNQVSFGSIPITNIHNLSCPCCKVKMITAKEFRKNITDAALSGSSQLAISAIEPYERNMHNIERLCFRIIEGASMNEPSKNLQEILQDLRPDSLKALKSSQFKILAIIDDIGKGLSFDSAMKLTELTNKNRAIISADNPYSPFKRKVFISKLLGLQEEIPEKDILKKCYKQALKLDTSENDVNAFIVKYSQRTSSEIGKRLLCKSVSTIEHIKPKADNGQNKMGNYIAECAGCNNHRGDMPFEEWVKMHPQMSENLQKYIDLIIIKINNGKLDGYTYYPVDVAKTLDNETKGLVKLDISKLKIDTQNPIEKMKNNFRFRNLQAE